MITRKKTQNQYIIPRNKSALNDQILIKEKLQLENTIPKKNMENGLEERKLLFKEKIIQGNSINEEDGYNLEVYNSSIAKDKNFLNIKNKNNNKSKTIPICHYFDELNNKILKFNNHNQLTNNDNNQNYCSNSIELNNNVNLNIEENENNFDENVYYLINNINIFKMMHNERKKYKILNRIFLKENNSERNIKKTKEKNNCITHKFSKKFKKKHNKDTDNGIIKKHSKMASLPFNDPNLRKNKITLVNRDKNSNKSISKSKSNYMININDDEFHPNNISNFVKIKPETKNLYSRYAKNNLNNPETKLNTTNDIYDKINKKNSKIKINTNNSCYDVKKKCLEKSNGCNFQNENDNYILNLKFYNLCNNSNKLNEINKKKSKSNSMINEYVGNDLEKENNNEESNRVLQENIPKNNIIKKRVIFEEEYIIDSNGNQKFLCVKRVVDTNDNNALNEQKNINKRNYTTNNLLSRGKNGNVCNLIDSNSKNNKIINGKLMRLKKNEKKLETKTVFISPQMNYQNICHKNNILANSKINNSDLKEKNDLSFVPKNNNPKINNIKIIKELNYLNSNKSCLFKNNHFHNCNNKNSNSINLYIMNKTNDNNGENSENVKHNKINRIQIIKKENPLNLKSQMKKQFEEKCQTMKNSRNFNSPNYINICDYHNKDNNIVKSGTSEKKKNNIKYIYTTTNYDNNKIIFPHQKLLNDSQKNNYQFHEIKSTSKEKLLNKITNSACKSQDNNFYFESEPRPQIVVCTSMDNIKKMCKDNYGYDEAISFKDKLAKSSRVTNIQRLIKPKFSLCYSQEIQNV